MMKVQWQIVDLDTGNAVKVDEPFEIVDFCRQYFDGKTQMVFPEAAILFGDPGAIKNPIGILHLQDAPRGVKCACPPKDGPFLDKIIYCPIHGNVRV